MAIVVSPQPPVSLFERASVQAGSAFGLLLDTPIFAKPATPPQAGYAYPRTAAVLSRVRATNLGGTTALVSARIVDTSFITYSATLVAGSGDGTDTLTFVGLGASGVALEPNYRLFDVTDPDVPDRTTLGVDIAGASSCGWSPDGRYLVATAQNTANRVMFYDFNTGSPVLVSPNPLTLRVQSVGVARFSPDGTQIAVGYADGVVEVHAWPGGGTPETLPSTPSASVTDLTWRPSGRYLAVTHQLAAGGLSVYDDDTGSWVKTALPAVNIPSPTRHVAWSPDDRYLAVAHSGGARLSVYDWDSGSPVLTAAPDIGAPTPLNYSDALAWSPDSRYIAQAGEESPFVRVYDMDSGSPVSEAEPPVVALGGGSCCVWSPDGGTLVLGYEIASDDEFTNVPYVVSYAFDGTTFTVNTTPDLRTQGAARGMAWNDTRDLLFILSFPLPNLNGPSLDNVRLLDGLGNNAISNGSFEDIAGLTATSYGYIGTPNGWTFTNGLGTPRQIKVYTNNKRGVVATNGIAWVDMLGGGSLDDTLTLPAHRRLTQAVAGLTSGDSYTLRFDAALMALASGGISVLWNGDLVALTSSLGTTGITLASPVDIRTVVSNVSVAAGATADLSLDKAILRGGNLLQVRSVNADCDVTASYVLTVASD